ncbi:phosphocholine cytidylyltransferase family protein [uncultured Desulfuromusa sp.]|uniref:phosphocholine cytidylyltransferase family protein n=1 Tax=uncultured Desulfuromusa sp. TaxID=219183 RepID=UPI002AA72925|nr:phosphocholine cytidylyltransferase family protein [uncultured Desulfuromusa sp.]
MNRNISNDGTAVKTALLLAAGMGSRLSPLTDSSPKCLVKVSRISILERLMRALRSHGFTKLFVVTGHLSETIEDYLGSHYLGIEIAYIASPLYNTTNNIYSLWLAGKDIDEPFLLVESDLVFQPELLTPMLQPDRIAISKMLPWMNGTTVTLNNLKILQGFCLGAESRNNSSHYKTVNIYNFSRNTWRLIQKRLDQYISAGKVNGYYEEVFAEMFAEGTISFAPVFFDASRWYEIDTLEDLGAAEKMFPETYKVKFAAEEKLLPLYKAIGKRSKEVLSYPIPSVSALPSVLPTPIG